MSRVIIILLFLNVISCFIFRVFIHRGKVNICDFTIPEFGQPKEINVLIAGFFTQPFSAYRELCQAHLAQEIYVIYSCFGWNAKNSAAQLDEALKKYTGKVNIYAISVGDKIARSMTRCNHIYSINPCPNPCVLRNEWQRKLPPLAILLEAVAFVLGWLSVIPAIPTDDSPYSLALIADQLWEISVNRSTKPYNKSLTSFVLSSKDEYINNDFIFHFYKTSWLPFETIETQHARTTDIAWGTEYNHALEQLQRR